MSEIPNPTDSGSSGTQQPSSGDAELIAPANALEGLPIARVMEGLAAARPRSMGGEIAAPLIAGSFSQLTHQLNETRNELKQAQSEIRSVRDSLTACKERSATLTERVSANTRERQLRNSTIFFGTILIGIGVDMLRGASTPIGFIITGLGVVLLVCGWLVRSGSGSEP